MEGFLDVRNLLSLSSFPGAGVWSGQQGPERKKSHDNPFRSSLCDYVKWVCAVKAHGSSLFYRSYGVVNFSVKEFYRLLTFLGLCTSVNQ